MTASAVSDTSVIPERYELREKDGVRVLECDEAPRLRVVIQPDMSISKAEAVALGERTILLDGAGNFGPLIDNDRRLYNLDHHTGCERLFTLSTCEQALLMIQSGLELSEGDWTIYANEPDLDTILAVWCLLNYRRVRELRPEARDILMPLLRLEGAIDSNGPEMARLCGLSAELMEQTLQRIDALLVREREMKRAGAWTEKNLHAYTLEMLGGIDTLVYVGEDFGDYTRIDEVYGHVEVSPRCVAVACRESAGIYTVEQHLKTRWGDQLGIIVLENHPGHYTLRRVSSVSAPPLEPAYELLNRVDAAVDGRPPGKCWGGSRDIGGSPRATGTELSAQEVLQTLVRAYRPSTWRMRTRSGSVALLVGMSLLACWLVPVGLRWLAPTLLPSRVIGVATDVAIAALLALVIGMLATRRASERRPWVFGWRLPANGGGWWLSPLLALGAVPYAVWVIQVPVARSSQWLALLLAGTLAIAAFEVWFRGLVHGLLVLDFPVQRPRGPWLLSRAALVSSGAYALVTTAFVSISFATAGPWQTAEREPVWALGVAAAYFVIGLALAVLRERSLSLLPGIAIQVGAFLLLGLGWYALG